MTEERKQEIATVVAQRMGLDNLPLAAAERIVEGYNVPKKERMEILEEIKQRLS